MHSQPMRIRVARCGKARQPAQLPANTVYVGPGSHWACPFQPNREQSRFEIMLEFCRWMRQMHPARRAEYLAPLRGKNLACTCHLRRYCHADILISWANEPSREVAR